MEQLPEMTPNVAGKLFFRLIQTLPTFWATWIWILIISITDIFWIPHFWISRFPDFQNLARAGLGPWADDDGSPSWRQYHTLSSRCGPIVPQPAEG